MKYRQLGNTGTRVSPLCLGTMSFGERVNQAMATRMIGEAVDAGINFVDTADCYGMGVSEQMIGKALKENGTREQVVVATKAVAQTGEGPNDRGASRFHLSRSVDNSLNRLKTDRIDLFYLHYYDLDTPMEETFGQLDILVKQGKILYVGTSKWPAPLLVEGLMMNEKYSYPRIIAEQPPYNLCDRSIEIELVWTCMRHGIGLCTWAPLAYGLLSGLYRKGKPTPKGHRFSDVKNNPSARRRFTPAVLELIEKLMPIADVKGIDLPALSHAWLQQRPGITSPIIGPRNITQLRQAIKTADITFTRDELDAIDAAIPPGTRVSPFYGGLSSLLMGA